MEIEIVIDQSQIEPKIIIKTSKLTQEVENIMNIISQQNPSIISGIKDEKLEIIDENAIIAVFAQDGKVYADTKNGIYELKLRLYELENILDKTRFVRISKSEIINLKAVKNFDLSFTGTISVEMKNGKISYVSRRFVSKIKKIFFIITISLNWFFNIMYPSIYFVQSFD